MSRGRGFYDVENRRRLERQRQAALTRVRQLQAQFDQASVSAIALGTSDHVRPRAIPRLAPPPADTASTVELAAWASAAEPIVASAVREIAEVRSKAQAADLARHLMAIAASGDLATPYKPEREGTSTSETLGEARAPSLEHLTAQIESVVTDLDADATATEREQVNGAARAVLLESTVSPFTLLTQLKVLVQQVGTSAAEREHDRQKALGLLRSLDGIVGNEVDDLRQLLERVVGGSTPLTGVDAARVSDVRARAIVEEDRQYVAEHLAAAFSELGYEVDGQFARELASGDRAYAFLSESPDHAVEIQLGAGRYSYRLVHTDPGADPTRDAGFELALCKAIGHATSEGHERGVQFTIDDHHAPGSEPVAFVAEARERRQQTASDALKLRERKL